MSGDSDKTTTSTSTEPAEWSQEGYDWAGDAATAAAQAGTLVQPNTMSTVVPYSQQTTDAMASSDWYSGYAQDRANQAYESVYDNVETGGLNSLQRQSVNELQQTIGSEYSTASNPGFQDVLDQSIQETSDAVNQNAASMGRYNSGTHQGVLAEEVGNLTSSMINDDYNRYLERYDSAVSELFNAGQTQMTNVNTNASALNDAYGYTEVPRDQKMEIGAMYEDLYARQMNDALRIEDETSSQDADNIAALLAMLGGSGQYTDTTTTAQGASSDWSNILGGLLGASSLLSL
jgi:hypothetical protein